MTASATVDPVSSSPSVSTDAVSAVAVPAAVPAPASALSVAPAPASGQPTPADVLSGRALIDDLDARILALISERIATAADIQSARIAEGGRRLDLKRETEIIARYREALGRPGVTVAMAVLELCRGRV